jgi:hypothetical protein
MNALLALLKPLFASILAEAIVKIIQKLESDPEFRARAGVVYTQVISSTTPKETSDASKAVFDLIRK